MSRRTKILRIYGLQTDFMQGAFGIADLSTEYVRQGDISGFWQAQKLISRHQMLFEDLSD